MIDRKTVDSFTEKLRDRLPPGLDALRDDAGDNLKSMVRAALERMDVVSREDYELQRAMLERMRERVDALEARLDALENADKSAP